MPKQCFIAPDLFKPAQWAHAVKVGNTVYTSGVTARAKDGGIIGRGDFVAQTEQTFKNMESMLRAAGASWSDVIKVHFYWPTSTITPDQWRGHRQVRDRYLSPGRYAGVAARMATQDPEILFEMECIAYLGADKKVILGVPNVYMPPGWAHAVRAGDTLYASGQHAILARGSAADISQATAAHKGDTEAQTRFVYKNLGAVLKAAGATWDNVIRVNNYVTREDGMDPMRAGRKGYMPAGKAMSTSVRCLLAHQDCVIETGLEAYLGPKQGYTSLEVWQVPGTIQASRTGNTVYLQGQVPCDKAGELVGRGDIKAQAERLYQNAGAMLKAAGASWADVVAVRGYYLRKEDFLPVRQVRAQYLKDGSYASAGLLAQFFTPHSPDMLLEVEFVAVTG